MNIIAHRGYWLCEPEKNTLIALERALEHGFGFETDYRDFDGEIVISHNIPKGVEPKAEEVFQLYNKYYSQATLAINVKSDGLQESLKGLLEKYSISNYFLFDMSVPDTIGYVALGMQIASRRSEYEVELPFYKNSNIVWLDCFKGDWITEQDISIHLEAGKKVCIVSPELHKRPHKEVWEKYKNIQNGNVMLCTDYPEEAKSFFNQ